jgi:CMP/dCMP kinase
MNNILTIDGPTGVGKGTVGMRMANDLSWHYLDSGIHYRLLAHIAMEHGYLPEQADELIACFAKAQVVIKHDSEQGCSRIWLENKEITQDLRSEACGNMSSKLSSIPAVRDSLLLAQRAYAKPPGLVTDGRDMGSVVFPDAKFKVFLDADTQERGKRRYKQLKLKDIDVNLDEVVLDLQARDHRDRTRAIAPLRPAKDAYVIDTTAMTIDQVCQAIMDYMGLNGRL